LKSNGLTRRRALGWAGLVLGGGLFSHPALRAGADPRRPPRQLLVTVRQETGPAVPEGGGHAYSSRNPADRQSVQQVRVVEGGHAYVDLQQSVPVVSQAVGGGPRAGFAAEAVEYYDVHDGLHVTPTLSGDDVLLEVRSVSTAATSLSGLPAGQAGPPAFATQQIATTVRGPLGQWIEVGGTARTVPEGSGRTLSSTEAHGSGRRVWVKVEEVR